MPQRTLRRLAATQGKKEHDILIRLLYPAFPRHQVAMDFPAISIPSCDDVRHGDPLRSPDSVPQ